MRRNLAIILILFLTAFFCCLFGWALFKFCRRSIDAKFHEMQYLEAQAGGSGSKKSGSGSKKSGSGSKKSGSGSKKSGSKKSSSEGSKKSGEQAAGWD
jgi:hypothetical protein